MGVEAVQTAMTFLRPMLAIPRRRLCPLRATANRHALGQRPSRYAEASLHEVIAYLAIEGKAIRIDPERDRRTGPG